ncbi:MAG: hypothetical protein HLUCCA11_23465 [Phormidesmis priestleyi Ana]|uniref:Uncharacterized protein n=1 Tax=Phormidesmis priestleyi Ana TaxID=1666911 RepID=A0A0P8BDA1_9CYAN|nr:MAG: hypothetical protein HLUCCA11_23465 [Phormidesmis priestleyi Ana]
MTQTDLHPAPSATCINDGYAEVSEVAAALSRHERMVRQYIHLLREDFGHPGFLQKRNGRFSGGDATRSLNHQQLLPLPRQVSARCIPFSNLPPPCKLQLRAPPKQIKARIRLTVYMRGNYCSHFVMAIEALACLSLVGKPRSSLTAEIIFREQIDSQQIESL